MDSQPFRFFDLHAELRCMVYERLKFPTIWHVLDRAQAHLTRRIWPVPPKAHIHDSRVTLNRPHTPLEILLAWRFVNKEALKFLKRKAEHCKLQPLRYLVDYSAAWALTAPWTDLGPCLGLVDWLWSNKGNKPIVEFVQLCTHHLSQTRRPATHPGPRGVRAIELTITHKSDVVYGMEVFEAIFSLLEIKYFGPQRLVVVYKTPLPRITTPGDAKMYNLNDIKADLLQRIPEEPAESSERGVFIRPLREEAFDRHLEGLESY